MNIDNMIFILDSYKKYSEKNKDNKKFLENLKELFLSGDVEKDVYNAMVYIVTGNKEKTNTPQLFVKVENKNVDPCSRLPSHSYKPYVSDSCSSSSKGRC